MKTTEFIPDICAHCERSYESPHSNATEAELFCSAACEQESGDSLRAFAAALNTAPPVAEAPFALTSPVGRRSSVQKTLF